MIKQISGSQMISEALHEEGVEIVFGYPGGAALNIYDETYKQTYFKHVLVRHEQAAVHAADGYARVSGKVGVAYKRSHWSCHGLQRQHPSCAYKRSSTNLYDRHRCLSRD